MTISKLLNKYKALPVQVKASFWFLICGFLAKGVSVITTPIFTRLMTSEEYGQFNTFSSWCGIISVFVSLNLCSGVYSRGLVVYEDRRKEYSSSLQGLCLTLCVAWTIVYFIGKDFWNHLFSVTTLQMISMLLIIWLNCVFQFWSLNQRVDYKYQKLVAVTAIVTVGQPLLGVILVVNAEDTVTARILGMVIVNVVVYIWLFAYQMFQGKKFYIKEFWKHAIVFNLPLVPHYLSMTVLNSADRIMINNMVSADKAGIYSLAYSISQIMIIFNTALIQTFEPWLYKKIKAKQIEDISAIATPSFLLIAMLNVLLMIFAPEIIAVFAPAEYYEAIWIIPPVAISVFFMYLYTFFAIFEFYYEKTKYVMVATTSGAILNIILNFISIKKFGYFAAGYTTLICYILFAVFHYYYMTKICNAYLDGCKPYKLKTLLIISGVLLLCGILILLTYNHMWLRYGALVIAVVICCVKRKELMNGLKSIVAIRKERS